MASPERRSRPILACLVSAILASAVPAAGQPYVHEQLVQPVYVTVAPTYGDVELEGDVLAYGVREEIDAIGFAEGAVFLFGRDQGGAGNWGLIKKLHSPAPSIGQGFGTAVELQGDELFVVSPYFNGPAGVVRIFGRNVGGADNWGLVREVVEPESQVCELGRSMDVEGDILVVGSRCGVTGQEGRVFVYERDLGGPGNWGRRQTLAPADVETTDWFGTSVALSGNLLAVGAPLREPGDWTTNTNNGAVYLFRRDPATGLWVEWRILTDNAGTNAWLGRNVALDGSTLLASREGDNRISVYRCWQGGPGNWGYAGDLVPPTGSFAIGDLSESIVIDGALAVVAGSTHGWVYDLYDWPAFGDELQELLPSGGTHSFNFVSVDGGRIAAAGAIIGVSTYVIEIWAAPTADLSVAVDDGQTIAIPGTTLSYEIVFSNAGAATAAGAQLEVDLSGSSLDLANVAWTCDTSPGAGAGTTCPLAAGTWSDLENGPLPFGIEPGDLVSISLDAPVLVAASAPPECRSRVRAPAALAVDPDPSGNAALDRDALGGPLIFTDGFEGGDLVVWWGQGGCP